MKTHKYFLIELNIRTLYLREKTLFLKELKFSHNLFRMKMVSLQKAETRLLKPASSVAHIIRISKKMDLNKFRFS